MSASAYEPCARRIHEHAETAAPIRVAVTCAQVFKEQTAPDRRRRSWGGRSRTFGRGVQSAIREPSRTPVRSGGIEPADLRVRAGCLTFKLRARIARGTPGNRTRALPGKSRLLRLGANVPLLSALDRCVSRHTSRVRVDGLLHAPRSAGLTASRCDDVSADVESQMAESNGSARRQPGYNRPQLPCC